MQTQVISVVQEKGGAGKTTLLETIAAQLVKDGARIALIDTDDRENLYRWASKEAISTDYLALIDDEKLIPTVRKLKEAAYDAVLIDTAGYKSAMAIYAINAANLVLIPSKADEGDAVCAVRTYRHVQSVGENMDKEIPAYVVLTDVDPRTNITREIQSALISQGVPLLDVLVGHATGFKEMKSSGTGPTSGTAARESKKLIATLQEKQLLWYYQEGGQWEKSA